MPSNTSLVSKIVSVILTCLNVGDLLWFASTTVISVLKFQFKGIRNYAIHLKKYEYALTVKAEALDRTEPSPSGDNLN